MRTKAYNAERRIVGDEYPGIGHPAVKRHACPTCGAERGEPCIVVRPRSAGSLVGGTAVAVVHTRTHRTRLNRWRMAQDKRRAAR